MLGLCATKLIHEAAMALLTRNSLQDFTVRIALLSQHEISLLMVERVSKKTIDSNARISLSVQCLPANILFQGLLKFAH